MIEQDKKKFQILMLGAGEIYGKEINKTLLQIYFQALIQYSMEEVDRGFTKHFVDPKNGTFFPKPADIVRMIGSDKPSVEDSARLAWLAIIGEIRRTGAYGALKLQDKLALAALKSIGGWNHLCMSQESSLPFIEKEFISAYQAMERTPLESLPESLPGLEQIHQHKLESKGQMQNIANKVDEMRKLHNLNKED